MRFQAQMLHSRRVANVVEERVEERDRQVLMGVFDLKGIIGSGFLVPENPSCKQSVEDGLDQRRAKEPCALFVIDVEREPESLPVIV